MRGKGIKNVSHSVSMRLKTFASEKKIAFEFVLLRYAIERFLYRLGKSSHADRFVLKGASAFAVWASPTFRATRDADLHCHGNSTPEFLKQCFIEICQTKVPDDGLALDLASMQTSEIKKGDPYKGIRITLNARISQARVRLQFDIGFGDSVYPAAQLHDYPVLLKQECPRIRVYPFYTVTAEKFEAMVSLGMSNSRVKDFFDIWLLSEICDFDGALLHETLSRTFARRNTALPDSMPLALTEEFYSDNLKCSFWDTFIRKTIPEHYPASLGKAAERIAELIMPVILNEKHQLMTWSKTEGWK